MTNTEQNNFFDLVVKEKSSIQKVLVDLVSEEVPDLKGLDEKALFDPLVFSYFNFHGEDFMSLKQILWGYMKNKPTKTLVKSNVNGCIYLPNYGYLITDAPNEELQLQVRQGEI